MSRGVCYASGVLSRLPYALMLVGLTMMLAGALHCVGERPAGEFTARSAGSETAVSGASTRTRVDAGATSTEAVDADAGAPPHEQAPLRVESWPALSPLTPSVVADLRAIAARGEAQRDDVFAKLGGSSVVSHAFLHCFRGQNVVLGEHTELQATIDFFAHGRAGGTSPFTRESLATHEGWSIRHGLTGRPTRVEQEVRAISPRYAFALFGGNDVMARRPRTFHRHLLRLIEKLERRGVIPILGSTMPRRARSDMEEWARRYDGVSRAVAISRGLPYMDVHALALELPGRGLARDGVHPNVYLDHRRSRACDFTEEGVRHGQNVRNLLAIQTLDRLRRALTAGEPPPDADPPETQGDGSALAPVEVERLPFAEFRTREMSAAGDLTGSACTPERSVAVPARLYRVIISEPLRVRAWAFTTDGESLPIALLGADASPASCVSAHRDGLFELAEGSWVFAVEALGDPEFTFSLTAE